MSRFFGLLLALFLVSPAKADSTVAALTAAAALGGTELFYCVQGGADRKCTASQIATFAWTSPTLTNATVTGSFTATGLVTNADLVNAATTVNGVTCTLGSTCTVAAAAGTLTGATLAAGVTASSLTSVGTLTSLTVSGGLTTNITGGGTVCVQATNAGLLQSAGAACGSGSGITIGTTTITSGTTLRLLYDNAGVVGETAGITFTNTGQFTLAGGTIISSIPALDISQTWNNAGVTFTAFKINATSTASGANSLLADFETGSATVVSISKFGEVVIASSGTLGFGAQATYSTWIDVPSSTRLDFHVSSTAIVEINTTFPSGIFGIRANSAFGWNSTDFGGGSFDVVLARDTADSLAQRRTTNAQTFRVYNTFTDASNYERGVFDWITTANVLKIGSENAGSGVARNVQLVTAGGTVEVNTGTTSAFADITHRTNTASPIAFASLPACSAGQNKGMRATVSNASTASPTFLALVASGGSPNILPVYCTGGGWVYG